MVIDGSDGESKKMRRRNMEDEGEDGRGSAVETGGASTNYRGPIVFYIFLSISAVPSIICRLYKLTFPAQAQVTLQLLSSVFPI